MSAAPYGPWLGKDFPLRYVSPSRGTYADIFTSFEECSDKLHEKKKIKK